MIVAKKKGKTVKAYRLGTDDPVINYLIAEGKIIPKEDGSFEVMSLESVNGKGETAQSGDYIKLDSSGFPYPNEKVFFEENHRHIRDDEYEQIPKPLLAWTFDEPMIDEVDYLLQHKGLVLDEESENRFFTAPLWGTIESAPRDSVLVFYFITRGEKGEITDVDFNFVAKPEFDRTYSIIE